MKYAGFFAALLWSATALAQASPPSCNMATIGNNAGPGTNGANYSGSFGTNSAQLMPASPNNLPRSGMFVQCLTASCQFALNTAGQGASLTIAGSIVMNGQFSYFNAASFGFVPQGPVNIVTNAASTAISAFACPQ